ncbi:MAG: hypothetical protein IKU58_06560 [Clostridia bacterium]|nr:hypothetical protein [Clostridia bacterium]
MARKDRVYEDDDGRTIADMSDLSRPGMLGGFRKVQRPAAPQPEEPQRDEPWREAEPLMTPEERRWYVLGALKAAILIGLAFIVGLGLVVLLFVAGANMA